MRRERIIQQLRDYRSRWASESATADQFIDFISSHGGCFDRELQIGHITGSAWVVNGTGTHVLLTHHRKLDRWLQVGGHADGDSDVLRVAMREAKEESGLESIVPAGEHIFDIDVHSIPERGDEPEHYHWDIRYALRATGNETYVVSEESHDLAWIEIASMKTFTEEGSLLRMASKWQGQHT